jgi:hypothetical protein
MKSVARKGQNNIYFFRGGIPLPMPILASATTIAELMLHLTPPPPPYK